VNAAPFDLFPAPFQRLARLAEGGREEEFRLARRCAAEILESLGSAHRDVGRGPDLAPVWPAGYTGSITHTRELVAVVARPCGLSRAVGIDAETLVGIDDAARIERYCLAAGELDGLREAAALPRRELMTLLFSAKEAFFKCLYPGLRARFEPAEAVAEALRLDAGKLRLRHGKDALEGSFRFEAGHVFTAFELAA
jgi:enterobactin synthetase component D